MKRPRPSNAPGPKRHAPPCPPIDPALVYPIRRLSDWSFGNRGRAALIRAGLHVIQFGKLKFFKGAELIRVLESTHPTVSPPTPADIQRHNAALADISTRLDGLVAAYYIADSEANFSALDRLARDLRDLANAAQQR